MQPRLRIGSIVSFDLRKRWTCAFLAGRYDVAIEVSRNAIELDANSLAHLSLRFAYVKKGMIEQGISEIKKAIEISDGKIANLKSDLASAYAKAGNTNEVRNILADSLRMGEQGYKYEPEIASIYVSLNEYDKAMEWLETAYAQRAGYTVFINCDPNFDNLRPDPRFRTLLKKIGCTEAS